MGAAAAGDAADEAEELVLELRGELGHGAVEGRASCGGTKKGPARCERAHLNLVVGAASSTLAMGLVSIYCASATTGYRS